MGRHSGTRPTAADTQAVYRENVAEVYAYFSYSVGRQTAEDLTAATFERVVRAWHRFDRSRGSTRTWTLAIARNVLIDHYRREQFRNGASLDEHPAIADALVSHEDVAASLLDREAITEMLSHLTGRERDVLALRYGAGLSTADIAVCLGISQQQVYGAASRGLRRLRSLLDPPQIVDTSSTTTRR